MTEQDRKEFYEWCKVKDFVEYADFTRDGYQSIFVKVSRSINPGQVTRLCNRAYGAGLVPQIENGHPRTFTYEKIPIGN